MFCAISGQVPEEPVFSKKTGHIFEKRLILQHIEKEGKCPVTDVDLTADDLLPVACNPAVKPRTSSTSSIPGLLNVFQTEWDSLMLETFELKKHLDLARRELSQALYQYDAACRVIARLIKERDDARQALISSGGSANGPKDGVEEEASGLRALIGEILSFSKVLQNDRKSRQVPDSYASVDEIRSLVLKSAPQYHQTKSGTIHSLALHITLPYLFSGGGDHEVKVYDYAEGKVVASLKGHTKRVNAVALGPRDIVLSGSADKSIRVWNQDISGSIGYKASIIASHTTEVTDLSLHPTSKYFASTSQECWCFQDLDRCETIQKFQDPEMKSGFTTGKFHPDGVLYATGYGDGVVSIWDTQKQEVAARLEGHTSSISSISFSENGYSLATSSLDGSVRIWDLRKVKCVKSLSGEGEVQTAQFDSSAGYLAIGGVDVRLYSVKGWELLKTWDDAKGAVTSLCFGRDGRSLFAGSQDKHVRIYTVPASSD